MVLSLNQKKIIAVWFKEFSCYAFWFYCACVAIIAIYLSGVTKEILYLVQQKINSSGFKLDKLKN